MTIARIDMIINCKYLIPVIPENTVLFDYSIAVHDGKILQIGPYKDIESKWNAIKYEDLQNHCVLPGLINSYSQASMSLLNNFQLGEGNSSRIKQLKSIQSTLVDEDFVSEGSLIGINQMVKKGITCFSDNFFFPENTISISKSVGIRTQIGLILARDSSVYAKNFEEYIHKGLRARDQYKDLSLVTFAIAPINSFSLDDHLLGEIAKYTNELDLPIQSLCNENKYEIEKSIEYSGSRPLQRLNEHGLLNNQTQLSGIYDLNEEDFELLKVTKSNILFCPFATNYSGQYVFKLFNTLEEEQNIAFGSDGADSGFEIDLFNAMRTSALIARVNYKSELKTMAHRLLRMGTINGARALGLDDKIGSLETDKEADIIAIELSDSDVISANQIAEHIVFSNSGSHVSDSWVSGKNLMRKRVVKNIPQSKIDRICNKWSSKLSGNFITRHSQ
tara:strand:+ start:793 stop:2133 length:1341 start_codon:yes stop_codon:yes gene_type:complete